MKGVKIFVMIKKYQKMTKSQESLIGMVNDRPKQNGNGLKNIKALSGNTIQTRVSN